MEAIKDFFSPVASTYGKWRKQKNTWLGNLSIVLIAALFSWQVSFSFGADYGIYFIGAKFADYEFSLYEKFFDHKGPLTYLILKGFIHLFGFSIFSASLFLFTITTTFLILIRELARTQDRLLNILVIAFCSIILFAQSSNVVINLLAANIVLFSYKIIEKIKNSGGLFPLATFVFCLISLTFTAPWVVIPVFVWVIPVIMRYSLNEGVLILCFGLSIVFLFFSLFHYFLGVTITGYFDTNFLFNVIDYPKIIRSQSDLSQISGIFLQSRLLTISAIPMCLILYLSLLQGIKQDFSLRVSTLLLIFQSLLPGTDHIHYVIWIVIALVLTIRNVPSVDMHKAIPTFVASTLALIILLSPSLYGKAPYYICAIGLNASTCESQYSNLTAKIDGLGEFKHEFLGNDAWPYLLTNQVPKVNFASNYVLTRDQSNVRRMHVYWVKNSANLNYGLGDFLHSLQTNDHYLGSLKAGDWVGYQIG